MHVWLRSWGQTPYSLARYAPTNCWSMYNTSGRKFHSLSDSISLLLSFQGQAAVRERSVWRNWHSFHRFPASHSIINWYSHITQTRPLHIFILSQLFSVPITPPSLFFQLLFFLTLASYVCMFFASIILDGLYGVPYSFAFIMALSAFVICPFILKLCAVFKIMRLCLAHASGCVHDARRGCG